MSVRIVQSKENSRIKQLRRALTAPPRLLQKPASPESANSEPTLVGIEGPNLVSEALRAKIRIDCLFVAQGHDHLLADLGVPAETETLLVPRALLDSVLATETPQPVAALVDPPQWTWADLFNRNHGPALILVLAGLQDPGNLGTILRSAEAFGASGVIALPGTANPWNPKAVRASAGSVFRLPLLPVEVERLLSALRQAGVNMLTTAITGAMPADRVELTQSVALLIGNEGNGVPEEIAATRRWSDHDSLPRPG